MSRSELVVDAQPISQKRRQQIVEAAVSLFSEKGYFQTTIDDIASASGISKGLVYRYFKDKNALLFYALYVVLEKYDKAYFSELVQRVNPLLALVTIQRALCAMAEEHGAEIALAYRSTKDLLAPERREIKVSEAQIIRLIRQCLDGAVHNAWMRPINTDILSYQYLMYAHTWALKNWFFRDRYSPEEYASEGQALLIETFLTEEGNKVLLDMHKFTAERTS